MSTTHTPSIGGGARVRFFGPKEKFPRPGAWAIVKDRLGIIYELTDATAKDGSTVAAAIVHFLKEDGTTEMRLDEATMRPVAGEVVPLTSLRKATYAEIHAHPRNSSLSAHDAAVLGYELSTEHIESLTALQRKRLNLTLHDEDAAQALIEEEHEAHLAAQRAAVAKHPDAIALEAQIETERQAFVASVEARRAELFAKLVK